MFSRENPSEARCGDLDKIEYEWTRRTREHAVLVATCQKVNQYNQVVGVFAAYKEAFDLTTDPDQFALQNKWREDLKCEIADQIYNPPFGHFDLETYVSIHNTSIRTRA
jgi:hypothetical protein